MTLNDYLLAAWNMMANSGPVARVAEKKFQVSENNDPIVVHENRKNQDYNGLYQDNGLIKIVNGPEQNKTLNHEMAHNRYQGMYEALEPLGVDAQNWKPLTDVLGFQDMVKQHDPRAYTEINRRLSSPAYKNYIDVPSEFYAFYSNMPKAPELRKYY